MSKPLSIDKAVDGNLKPVKDSDGTMTALEISTDDVRVKGLETAGDAKISGELTVGETAIFQGKVAVPEGKPLYFDGGDDTYIYEHSADSVRYVVGGDMIMAMTEAGVQEIQLILGLQEQDLHKLQLLLVRLILIVILTELGIRLI